MQYHAIIPIDQTRFKLKKTSLSSKYDVFPKENIKQRKMQNVYNRSVKKTNIRTTKTKIVKKTKKPTKTTKSKIINKIKIRKIVKKVKMQKVTELESLEMNRRKKIKTQAT